MNDEMSLEQMKMMLLKSLFDYKYANDGASYQLPAELLSMQPMSEEAIRGLIAEGFAEDTSEDASYLLLHITDAGVTEIKQIYGM